ncbi:MAG: hypothetical protein EA418_05635 [Wenzhouxiangellaceae bacterium]|nr:MAG: hypothetical protein EA418_05635 [Wenzhouxiangellaceae bacterium]
MPRAFSISGLALRLLAALALGAVLNTAVLAEDWPPSTLPELDGFPSQPIRLIVYTSPGGLIDVTARRFARIAQEVADHPFAVINRPGGGGIVAFEEALREPADGHRFLAVTRSNISKMVASGREDLIDRIHWHSYIMDNAHVLITNKEEGPRNWQELLVANGQRDQRWLGVDIGGVKHISGVKMAERAGIDMRWIPYGSGGEAVAALLGGLGTAYLGNPRDALTSDRLRVVVVAADNRLREFPDAPTFAELGIEGLEDELIWRGFAFRKGVSDEIHAWYSALIRQVLHDPRWVSSWQHEAVNLRYRSHADFQRVVQRDREEFRRYLAELQLLPEEAESAAGLRRLSQGNGLFGAIGTAAALVAGIALVLPRRTGRMRAGELALLSALSAAGLILLLMSLALPSANPVDPIGPGGVPRLWIAVLLPLAAWQVWACLRNNPEPDQSLHTGRMLATVGLFLAYLLLIPALGYLLASLIYMPTLIWYLGYRRLVVIAGLTVSWLLFSEFVFQRLLHVDLPRGFW